MSQAPSIGRIVLYHSGEDDTFAAIITGLAEDNAVYLTVFPPRSLPGYVSTPVPHSETPQPGCWSWPPRA